MPPTPDAFADRERLVRLEVQMESLTDELSETKEAVMELTTALHELKGAFRGAMWVGGLIASAVAAVTWAASWAFDRVWGGA